MAGNETRDAGALPDGWVWTTIGEITQPIEKVKPKEYPETIFTYLDISSIDNTANRIAEPKVYCGAEAPSRARQLVYAKDVLFSTVRTYLKNIALVPETYDGQIASTGFSVLRGKPGIEPKYLFYYSLTDEFLNELGKLQRGTSYPAVRDGDVREQPIPLPPSAEQRRIVAAIETQFTRLEAGVAALKRAQVGLRRYKAAVLKAACEGRLLPTEIELHRRGVVGRGEVTSPLPPEPAGVLLARILAERRARWEAERWEYEIERAQKKAVQAERKAAGLPYYIRDLDPKDWQNIPEEEYAPYLPKSDKWKQKHDEPKPPDTEDLPELPEGWIWISLEQLAEFRNGINFTKVQKGEQGILTIDVLSMYSQGAYVDLSSLYRVNVKTKKDHLLRNGDLLFVRSSVKREGVGWASLFRETQEPVTFCGFIIRARMVSEEVVPEYLLYHARSSSARERIIASGSQVTITNISQAALGKLPVSLPPLAEQHRIVAEVERRLSVVAELEKQVEAALRRAGRLRQAVLKHAFEGKLVPQDPTDEPASALLERIRAVRGKRRGKVPPTQIAPNAITNPVGAR